MFKKTSRLIYDLNLPALQSLLKTWEEPSYRALQIWRGLYQNYWNSAEEFTNLPVSLRSKLADALTYKTLVPVTTLRSHDGKTVKTLFQLHDGEAIETVLMKYDKRRTLCISTQVGCAMGCVFCATGQMGFHRHLSSGEIVAQVMNFSHLLNENKDTLTNIVIMGMGEPFHNYDHTMEAIDRLNDPDGFNFGARRFTLSTVGLIPEIRRFAIEKRQVNLAISLHAADTALRSSMLPINKKYPLTELLEACREYVTVTKRRITFEWALVFGINDTPEQARLLVSKLKGILCHVNVIPLNPTAGYAGQASSRQRAEEFQNILKYHGIPCTIRMRRGIEIEAGCGQLLVEKRK